MHWAAAVNNVEAAVVLLKNGANKDMQNNKVGRAGGHPRAGLQGTAPAPLLLPMGPQTSDLKCRALASRRAACG